MESGSDCCGAEKFVVGLHIVEKVEAPLFVEWSNHYQ